jgi:hypothetical protein
MVARVKRAGAVCCTRASDGFVAGGGLSRNFASGILPVCVDVSCCGLVQPDTVPAVPLALVSPAAANARQAANFHPLGEAGCTPGHSKHMAVFLNSLYLYPE